MQLCQIFRRINIPRIVYYYKLGHSYIINISDGETGLSLFEIAYFQSFFRFHKSLLIWTIGSFMKLRDVNLMLILIFFGDWFHFRDSQTSDEHAVLENR